MLSESAISSVLVDETLDVLDMYDEKRFEEDLKKIQSSEEILVESPKSRVRLFSVVGWNIPIKELMLNI